MVHFLNVFYRDQLAGRLASDQGVLSFQYAPEYLAQPQATKLSISLPLQTDAFPHTVTRAYFSGLLPDERVRHWLAKFLHVSEGNVFGLLKEIGGDCAGAVSLYSSQQNIHNRHQTYHILDEAAAAAMLLNLDKRPFQVGQEGVRISGAGAQSKMMIAFVDGQMAIPTNDTPSTHIIKPAIEEFKDTVHNEFFCMRLAKAVGLPVPEVDIYYVQGKPYYLITRYDRVKTEDGYTRLHQEDFCQAMGISPDQKYENEGGPTLLDCFQLLDSRIAQGLMGGHEKLTLLQVVIFNFLIGNGDAHGKNFSVLYSSDTESLAPFYDLMSTMIYGDFFKEKMAMKLGGKYKFRDVVLRHFERLAKDIGFKPAYVEKQFLILSKETKTAAFQLMDELNSDPRTASPIYKDIVAIVEKQVQLVKK